MMNSTTYKNLIRPWPAFRGPRTSRAYYMGGRGAYIAATAVMGMVMLTVVGTYYVAYLYWVMLVTLVYGACLVVKGLASVAVRVARSRES